MAFTDPSSFPSREYPQLLSQIANTYSDGQMTAVQSVQQTMLRTYWQIGRHIVEFEQEGRVKSE